MRALRHADRPAALLRTARRLAAFCRIISAAMRAPVRRACAWCAAAVAGLCAPFQALALDADRPIVLIAQQPPGSQSEAITRAVADCVSRQLGQRVIVLNKPGANGVVATAFLKQQPADGYTMMTVGMSQMSITPYVYRKMPYDPVIDFDGIAVLTTNPLFLLASKRSGIQKLADIAAMAQTKAGGVNYGSPGKGSPAHLLTAALVLDLKFTGTHVPFVGEAAGAMALQSGDIDLMILTAGTAQILIKRDGANPLAVLADARHDAFPQVPNIVQLTGRNELAQPGWLALVVKAGTPQVVKDRLRGATARCALDDDAYRLRLSTMLAEPVSPASADLGSWTARYRSIFQPLIQQLELRE